MAFHYIDYSITATPIRYILQPTVHLHTDKSRKNIENERKMHAENTTTKWIIKNGGKKMKMENERKNNWQSEMHEKKKYI